MLHRSLMTIFCNVQCFFYCNFYMKVQFKAYFLLEVPSTSFLPHSDAILKCTDSDRKNKHTTKQL